MKNYSMQLLFLAFLFTGCQSDSKDFNLVFTMESIKAYKVSIEIGKDKTYRIEQQNLFFDAHAGKEQINRSEGMLTDEEYSELAKLIAGSRLFKMKNTYGFNETTGSGDPLEGLFYRLNYKEGRKSKYILIHPNPTDNYPEKLSQLINFLNNYISTHLEK